MSKWAIVSDIVRLLADYNQLGLNESEGENAHNDLANIMDYMITQNCSFKKAVKLYREEKCVDEELAEWIEQAIKLI